LKTLRFWINLTIGVAVAVFFFWLFFRSVTDWGEIWDALRTARYIYLVPAVLLVLSQYVFRAFRWYYLLHDVKRIHFFGLLSPMLIGFMGNCLLPARAGEFIRAYLISEKEDIKLTASLASLVVDRMFDMFVLLLLMGSILLFYPLDETVLQRTTGYSLADARLFLGVFVTSVFVALVAFTVLVYHKKELAAKIIDKAFFFLPSRFRNKVISLFMGFTEGLHIFRNWRHVAISIVLTLLQWGLGALAFYPLFYAFDVQENLSVFSSAAVLASAAVGVSIPTPGYAGPFHFFVQIGLQLCDASISDSVAKVFALVAHAVTFFPVIVIGIVLAFREGISLTQIEATSERLKESADQPD
jgi:uncharacterized protein (TIRG00374 family)